ncbi:hypothetical protein TNCV_5105271 [Trichonephila clavipes]|nr:hypothetical protein TNCV_5105271 [Trichonephila clavipes]
MNFSTSHLHSVSNSRHQFATPSHHVSTLIQVACSPPRTATSTGNINSYDMGRRLASRAICPVTSSDDFSDINVADARTRQVLPRGLFLRLGPTL